MTSFSQIPLKPTPQTFRISLGGVEYQLTLVYRRGWILDIADTNGTPILSGIPLVTGADLLAQYAHLNFGGRLWVQTISDPDAVPTFQNLGTDGVLWWAV